MRKLKLQLDDLLIDSFDTTAPQKAKGTVFGEQCTCYTQCTCPGCPTCDLSCNGTCGCATGGTCMGDWETCAYSCARTCYGSCPPDTCHQSCPIDAGESCFGAPC